MVAVVVKASRKKTCVMPLRRRQLCERAMMEEGRKISIIMNLD
jgi:hypothetical protein